MPRHRARDAATYSRAAARSSRSAAQVRGPRVGRGRCGPGGSRAGAASGAPGEAARRVPTPTNGRRGLLIAPWAPRVVCRANGLMGPPGGRHAAGWPACFTHTFRRAPALRVDVAGPGSQGSLRDLGMGGWGDPHAESAIAPPRSAERRRATPGPRVQWCRDSQPQDFISSNPTVCPCTMLRASSFPALPGHLGAIR